MRCQCCNNPLSSAEAVAKFKLSGEYTDTCNKCLRTMDVEVIRGGAVAEEDLYIEDEDKDYTTEVESWDFDEEE